jgi:ribosomal protein S18 acetylase RimI-like enzyme
MKPKKLRTYIQNMNEILIMKGFKQDIPINITSPYRPFFQAYFIKCEKEHGFIVSAYTKKEILGIGFIERNRITGSFFGEYLEELIQFAKINYAYLEDSTKSFPKMRIIERYDIWSIPNLSQQNLTYDELHIKPFDSKYLTSVIQLMGLEENGYNVFRNSKWIANAIQQDMIYLALIPFEDPWANIIPDQNITPILTAPPHLAKEYIVGIGFATRGEQMGWLHGLYVHPAFRNHSIGRDLVLARLNALKNEGINNALTEIAEWNRAPQKIYCKFMGFQQIGRIALTCKKLPQKSN